MYVFFTNAGSEHDSTGVEIYGARYQRALSKSEGSSFMDGTSADDREATHWGFGKSVQLTHANRVIDELDLYMTEDSKVSAVSNYFDQWIDDAGKIQYSANQLVEIEFEPKGSIEIKDSTVTLPESFVAGGKETEIASGHENSVLFAGEKQQVYAMWKIPENLGNTEIKITVKETGVDSAQPDVEDFSHLGIIDLSLRIYDGDKLIMNKLTQLASFVPVCAKIGDGKDISLKGDESVTLQAIAAPWGEAFGTPKYSSSNSSVAVVDDNGKVTTKGNGEAILYADYPRAGVTASVKVNVSGKATNGTDGNGGDTQNKAATKKITLKKKSVVIAPGKSKSVKYTATKAASVDNAAAVTAKSSNTKVVKAKVSGGKLKLTAVKNAAKGAKATVTLQSVNANGKTVSAKIKVSIRNKTKKLQAAKKTLTVKKGKTTKLTLHVTAENKKKPTTDTAKVKSGNVALAKASVGKGKIVVSLKGKKKGTKKVTLQVGDKKVSVMVTVR